MIPPGSLTRTNAIPLLSSVDESSSEASPGSAPDLMQVHYVRIQKDSPDFMTVFEGIDQHIDVELSTFVFSAAPEPVISLYDFIMTTFLPTGSDVGDTSSPRSPQATSSVDSEDVVQTHSDAHTENTDRIRLKLRLISVQRAYAFTQSTKTNTNSVFSYLTGQSQSGHSGPFHRQGHSYAPVQHYAACPSIRES